MSAAAVSQCAACGKQRDGLQKCSACKLVSYCDAACQKAHRPRHKRQCQQHAAFLESLARNGQILDEDLFREPEREDCPVCFLPLPGSYQTRYQECCGKEICGGCMHAIQIESYCRRGDEDGVPCPFCREPSSFSYEEKIKRLKQRMESGDGGAFLSMAAAYTFGKLGLRTSQKKAFDLNLRAGELGCAAGYHNVATAYLRGEGAEMDRAKARHYWKLAAMGGDEDSRSNLGEEELESGNIERAMKHFMIAVKAGCEDALDLVRESYVEGRATEDEYAAALRAYQTNRAETRSEMRDRYDSAPKY